MPAASRSAADALRPLLAGEAIGQLIRFGIAGLGVTLLSTALYAGAAMRLGLDPLVANVLSYLFGVTAGYAIHSRWSFRSDTGQEAAAVIRFLVASGAAFALNSLWVWLATRALHLPAWAPMPAMIFATPLGSFALNRYWVFA